VTLTHGRTRRRWAQRVALILYVIAGLIFFVAWAIMLALLILLVDVLRKGTDTMNEYAYADAVAKHLEGLRKELREEMRERLDAHAAMRRA
jgi:uncharacterized protein YoxC